MDSAPSLYRDLAALPDLVEEAWEQAQADPDRSPAILADLTRRVAHTAAVAAMHLNASGLASAHTAAVTDAIEVQGCFVYCLWDHHDQPLYVGCSENVLDRIGTHMSESGKRNRVAKVTMSRCADPERMREVERRLIAQMQPPLNVRGISVA